VGLPVAAGASLLLSSMTGVIALSRSWISLRGSTGSNLTEMLHMIIGLY
jgi:hypothetical protein